MAIKFAFLQTLQRGLWNNLDRSLMKPTLARSKTAGDFAAASAARLLDPTAADRRACPCSASDKMKYVVYDVCASTRVKLYTGIAHPHAAFRHTPALLQW
jgi:hypothetical protein